MDKIFECGNSFNNLLETQYIFTIVSKRKLQKIVLDFKKEDFRHASGLHYIDDIMIEQNPSKLLDAKRKDKKRRTDYTLSKS